MNQLPDQNLLEELKTENSHAFELLYKFYFPTIAVYIQQNSGDAHDAEDIFQEAIVVLLQKVRDPNFVLTSSLKTYLYAIAKNLWLKRLRDHNPNRMIMDNELISYPENDGLFHEERPHQTEPERVNSWLEKISIHCFDILKSIFFMQEPMDSSMKKMGWKNKNGKPNYLIKLNRFIFGFLMRGVENTYYG